MIAVDDSIDCANKKARFIGLDGYIITAAKDGSELKTQDNMQDGSWSFYHKGETKPYKCGPCLQKKVGIRTVWKA